MKEAEKAFVGVRVEPEVKAALEAEADKHGMSLNQFLQRLLNSKADGIQDPDVLKAKEMQKAARKEVAGLLSTGDFLFYTRNHLVDWCLLPWRYNDPANWIPVDEAEKLGLVKRADDGVLYVSRWQIRRKAQAKAA